MLNYANNNNNFLIEKPENVKVINELKKEKDDLLTELHKIKENYENLKKTTQNNVLSFDFNGSVHKDSGISPYFPAMQVLQPAPEEANVLKKTIENLTEEIKRLNVSLKNSPESKFHSPDKNCSPWIRLSF